MRRTAVKAANGEHFRLVDIVDRPRRAFCARSYANDAAEMNVSVESDAFRHADYCSTSVLFSISDRVVFG